MIKARRKGPLWDMLLILGFLLLAGVLFLLMQGNQEAGSYAVVQVNGAETARYSLLEDGSYPLNGGTNLLIIEDGTARISEANCPDALCVNQGKIRYSGQCITCLPNKLTVTISGAQGGVDLVS